MTEFIDNIRTRFGDGPALVAAIWIRMYIFGLETGANADNDYKELVRATIADVASHFNLSSEVFRTIVEESKSFIYRFGQTIH